MLDCVLWFVGQLVGLPFVAGGLRILEDQRTRLHHGRQVPIAQVLQVFAEYCCELFSPQGVPSAEVEDQLAQGLFTSPFSGDWQSLCQVGW